MRRLTRGALIWLSLIRSANAEPAWRFDFTVGPSHPQVARVANHSEPLPQAALARLLALLPAFPKQPADQVELALREASAPPPKSGRTILHPLETSLIPAPASTVVEPLKVISANPSGEIRPGTPLVVAFSQPMIELSGVGETEAARLPLKLTPQPPGKWSWLDTQTLCFEPTRWPGATVYEVMIPAGTRSLVATLPEPKDWTFSTTPLKLGQASPQGSGQLLRPQIFIPFDQAVPGPIRAQIHPRQNGRQQDIQCRPLTLGETVDPHLQERAAIMSPRTWVALSPLEALEMETDYTVTLDAKATSAEVPLRTTAEQSYQFNTHGLLRALDDKLEQLPQQTWALDFSSPLDAKKFDPTMVEVSPPLPDLKVRVRDNRLEISGSSQGRTVYSVQLSSALCDIFGQKLGPTRPICVKVSSSRQSLQMAQRGSLMQMLDADGPLIFADNGTTSNSYAYDVSDNRISVTQGGTTTDASYDPSDQLQARSQSGEVVESYTHDQDGNMISRTLASSGVTTNYAWTDFDDLTVLADPGSRELDFSDTGGIRRLKPTASG